MNAPKYVGHFWKLDNTLRTMTFSFAKDVDPVKGKHYHITSEGEPWQALRVRPQRENIPVAETHALVVEYLPDGATQYRHVNLSNGFYKRVDNG